MSPLVSERIWALPINAPSVKFLLYLVYRSGNNGALPSQREMAGEYKVSATTVSTLLSPLFELNIVLRPQGEKREGNSYRLHPLAARYDSIDAMHEAFQQAVTDMKNGNLPVLNLPEYQSAPPAQGQPVLRVAS
ncbi:MULTISPECIES: hypothetical protein [unclassified Streptomyces]|uniref:hypothetical protein n=1 Tax=unclassified Streptomyces TaxID=2593676 RepID=UPI0033B988BA